MKSRETWLSKHSIMGGNQAYPSPWKLRLVCWHSGPSNCEGHWHLYGTRNTRVTISPIHTHFILMYPWRLPWNTSAWRNSIIAIPQERSYYAAREEVVFLQEAIFITGALPMQFVALLFCLFIYLSYLWTLKRRLFWFTTLLANLAWSTRVLPLTNQRTLRQTHEPVFQMLTAGGRALWPEQCDKSSATETLS